MSAHKGDRVKLSIRLPKKLSTSFHVACYDRCLIKNDVVELLVQSWVAGKISLPPRRT